jgi:hypothetical protein
MLRQKKLVSVKKFSHGLHGELFFVGNIYAKNVENKQPLLGFTRKKT